MEFSNPFTRLDLGEVDSLAVQSYAGARLRSHQKAPSMFLTQDIEAHVPLSNSLSSGLTQLTEANWTS